MKTVIQNGIIHDAIHEAPYKADLLLENGKIAAIGRDFSGDEVIDVSNLQIYPGFVDAHTHIGMDGYGTGMEGIDYNEMNDVWTPQLRAIDGIDPLDHSFELARSGGVTCVCTGPGSANVLGGTFTVIKTAGRRVDDMVVVRETAMKCAFGENPKRVYRNKFDSSRMTTAAILREALFKAKRYGEKLEAAQGDVSKLPAFDLKLEALQPVLRGEMPLKAHAHKANDIFTAIRIAKEFGLKITLEHVTEGHLIVEELAETGLPLAVGPTMSHASKVELANKSWTTPGVLAKAGCPVSHHHRQLRHPAGESALVRRHGRPRRHGSLPGAPGHHHPSGAAHRRGGSGGLHRGGQGRRPGHCRRQPHGHRHPAPSG